jgi:hypothetical protein
MNSLLREEQPNRFSKVAEGKRKQRREKAAREVAKSLRKNPRLLQEPMSNSRLTSFPIRSRRGRESGDHGPSALGYIAAIAQVA